MKRWNKIALMLMNTKMVNSRRLYPMMRKTNKQTILKMMLVRLVKCGRPIRLHPYFRLLAQTQNYKKSNSLLMLLQLHMKMMVLQICKSKACINSHLNKSPVVKFLSMLHKTRFHQEVMSNLLVRHPFPSNLTMSKQKGAMKQHLLSIWLI